MPLAKATLHASLAQLFAHPPATVLECADGWASAMKDYALDIVPASTTVASAAPVLAAALAGTFQAPAAAAGMESAFAAFAVAVGGGMAGYTPVPPAGPVGWEAQFAGPMPSTHTEAAEQIANRIHAWMTTGTSTMVAPPNAVQPWS